MEFLSYEHLSTVSGGGKSIWAVLGYIGAFIAGFIAGIVNPQACKR